MLKIFTLCLAFVLSAPFVASAAVGGGEEVETVTVGSHQLHKPVLTAAEEYILGGQFDPASHTDFANTVAPYLATVNAEDVVTVLTRLNGASKLLDCTDADTADMVTRVLAQGLTWLSNNRDVEAGADTDLLTAAVAKSEEWEADDVVEQLATFLGNQQPAVEEEEEEGAASSSEEEEDYVDPDAAVGGLTRQMSEAHVDGEGEEEGGTSGEED